MYDVTLLDLNGDTTGYAGVDRISYVNQASFGPGSKMGVGDAEPGDCVLVLNVNAFTSVKIDVH